MFLHSRIACLAGGLLLALCLFSSAHADFTLVDNFDTYAVGAINGAGGWFAADTTSQVAVDPADASNQVLSVITDSTRLYRPLTVADGATRMLFFRFRFEDQLTCSFGLSNSSAPDQFGDFDAELGLSNAGNELRVNDGGNYEDLTLLQSSTWYNVWMLVNNDNSTTQIWLNTGDGEPADAGDRLSYLDGGNVIDTFDFRQVSSSDLRTFYIKTGGGSSTNSGPLYIDDIYIENSSDANLLNPVPEPGSFLLLSAAALGMVFMCRRGRAGS